MNIDLRNIPAKHQKIIEKIKNDDHWTNTNKKATLYCISQHFQMKKEISNQKEKINEQRQELITALEAINNFQKTFKVLKNFNK